MSGAGASPAARRTALVTGGSRGIGRALVEALAARGDEVHACARHEPTGGLPKGVTFHLCDITTSDAVGAMMAATAEASGRIDLLVNNAGVAGSNPLDAEADDGLWHAIVQTNLTGTYLSCKSALPYMPDSAGRIVNMASTLGLKGVADQTAYCAAKHGVVGFTKALALAVAPRGITVNAVCPGWVATDMAQQRYREVGVTEKEAAASVPLGRVATEQDVTAAVLFLASPEASHITGQTLTVDGGALA